MPDANIVADLPELRWRYLSAVPCALAPYDFGHSQAERRYPYIDAAGHDNTGRDPLRPHVRLYFLNTMIRPRGAPRLYPDVWATWRDALFDGSAGKLQHPDLGEFDARVLDGHVELSAETRSGIVVDVNFTETVLDLEASATFTTPKVSPATAAAAADAALAALNIPYPTGTGDTSILGAIKSVQGQLFSAALTVTGKINQVLGTISYFVDVVEKLNDPTAWPALTNLTSVYQSLNVLQAQVNKAVVRATATRVLVADTTLDAFATEVGNTLNDVMGLNLGALGKPYVPKGSTLRYYTGGIKPAGAFPPPTMAIGLP